MKSIVFLSLMFLIVSMFLYVPNTTAENEPYTQWSLPEGAKARLGKSWINDITCSPDGALLAVASQIGIWIYDVQTSEALALLTGHTGPIDRIAFSPNGNTLASGGQDNTLRLWDVGTRREIGTLEGYTGGPDSIWFSPDGRTLASLDDDNTLRLWDVDTQTQIRALEGYTGSLESVSFSPDGNIIVTGGQDNTVRLWDVDTRREIGTFEGHTEYVSSVSFSPDGNTIATGSAYGTILLWDVDTQTEIGKLEGHSGGVNSVVFSADGRILASGNNDRTVRLWDVGTQTEIGTLEVTNSGDAKAGNNITGVSFSTDGKTIACKVKLGRLFGGIHYVSFWDVDTQTRAQGYIGYTWEVVWVVAELVDAQRENIRTIVEGHSWWVGGVSFSPDGKIIAASVGDLIYQKTHYTSHESPRVYFPRIWDVGTLTEIYTRRIDWAYHRPYYRPNAFKNISFSPDGKMIVSACYVSVSETRSTLGTCLRDVATYADIGTLEIPSYGDIAVLSPDGYTLAILYDDRGWPNANVYLWDMETQARIGILYGDIGSVKSVAFSPDGRTLTTAGSIDATVRLWDVETQTEKAVLRGHTGWVNGVAFSPDGKTIVSGSNDRTVRLWDVETQTEIAILRGHTGWVNGVSFSPDGKTIVSGSNDRTVRIWDVDTRIEIGILEGHTDPVLSVSFSPDGKTIATGSDDGTVLLWELPQLTTETKYIAADVNKDGVVNIQDLVIVSNAFEAAEPDLNGDGVVNILDLIIVAQNFK